MQNYFDHGIYGDFSSFCAKIFFKARMYYFYNQERNTAIPLKHTEKNYLKNIYSYD